MSRSSRPLAVFVAVVAAAVALVSMVAGGSGSDRVVGPAASAPRVASTDGTPASATANTSMNATLTSESAAPDAAGADDVTSEMTAAEPADTSPVDAPVATGVPDSEPATANSSAADPDCAARGPSALVDRRRQRAWLCTDGQRVAEFPVTTAWSMPDPGRYKVYAKDLKATSSFGGHFSRMTHFVAFSYGKRTGARVAFHSLPKLSSGQYVQPENSVGKLNRRGESNGCIRMLDADVVKVWDHLQIGDPVIVLN